MRQVLGNQRSGSGEVRRSLVSRDSGQRSGDERREVVSVEAHQNGVSNIGQNVVNVGVGRNVLDELVDLGLGLGVVDLRVVGRNDSVGKAVDGVVSNHIVLGRGSVQGSRQENECRGFH